MSIDSDGLFHNLVAKGFNLALLVAILSCPGDVVCITELLTSDPLRAVATEVLNVLKYNPWAQKKSLC